MVMFAADRLLPASDLACKLPCHRADRAEYIGWRLSTGVILVPSAAALGPNAIVSAGAR